MDEIALTGREPGGRWRRRRSDIARLVVRRTAIGVPMLVVLSAGVFLLAAGSPLNPLVAYLGSGYQQATEAQKDQLAGQLGLDQPWWQSWLSWLGDVVTGDLGWSHLYSMPVAEVIASRLGWTLLLSGSALLVALVIALVMGTVAGARPGSVLDRVCSSIAVFVQAIPPFVLALGGVALFAVILRWAPAGGATAPGQEYTFAGVAGHLVLPMLALALTQIPWLMLSVRSSVASAMTSHAVTSATARGLGRRRLVAGHVLPVSLAPMVTIMGARLPELIVGAILVEEVFAWPGIAAAVVASAKALDFALLAALSVATTGVVLLGSLLADAAYLLLDPRVGADV